MRQLMAFKEREGGREGCPWSLVAQVLLRAPPPGDCLWWLGVGSGVVTITHAMQARDPRVSLTFGLPSGPLTILRLGLVAEALDVLPASPSSSLSSSSSSSSSLSSLLSDPCVRGRLASGWWDVVDAKPPPVWSNALPRCCGCMDEVFANAPAMFEYAEA